MMVTWTEGSILDWLDNAADKRRCINLDTAADRQGDNRLTTDSDSQNSSYWLQNRLDVEFRLGCSYYLSVTVTSWRDLFVLFPRPLPRCNLGPCWN